MCSYSCLRVSISLLISNKHEPLYKMEYHTSKWPADFSLLTENMHVPCYEVQNPETLQTVSCLTVSCSFWSNKSVQKAVKSYNIILSYTSTIPASVTVYFSKIDSSPAWCYLRFKTYLDGFSVSTGSGKQNKEKFMIWYKPAF